MARDDDALASDVAKAIRLPSDKRTRAEERLFDNKMQLRYVLHNLTITGLYVLFGIAVVLLLVRTWDLVAPKSCIWMTDEQVQALDNIVFSGLIGAILGKGFNRMFPDKD